MTFCVLRIVHNRPLSAVSSIESNFIDLRRCHQLSVHAPGFGNYNTLGPSGERNILAKVPVDVGYGGAIHFYASGAEHEAIGRGGLL